MGAAGATVHAADTPHMDWAVSSPTDIPSFPMVDTNIRPSTRVNLPNLLTTSPSLMLPLNLRLTQLPSLMLPHSLNPTCSLLRSTRLHNRILTLSLPHNMGLPPHPLQRHIHNLNMLN